MTVRLLCCAVFGLVWSSAAMAEKPVLSADGEMLGRVTVSELNPMLRITIDLAGDDPHETYVMARFQNNQPQQRLPNGSWALWNEQTDSLLDNEFTPNEDGTLTFDLIYDDLSGQFLPIVFTVAYQTESGLKSGHVMIDQ